MLTTRVDPTRAARLQHVSIIVYAKSLGRTLLNVLYSWNN